VNMMMEAARSSKMLLSYCNTEWHHNSKDFNLKRFVSILMSLHTTICAILSLNVTIGL